MSKNYHSLAGGSFTQNWTNTGQITANDDWGGVPGIEGFLGQDITTSTGTDPQTLTGDSGVAGDLDIIANQTNPDTLATGGVAEFDGIADPSVALNGSGTADAPHLIVYLNTIGVQNVRVQYDARDLDGSIDDAASPLALQYRVGETGNWTNVPAAFIADATTGPSLATLVTHVDVTLPAAVQNQAKVQIRIITTNSAGNDEWIGIDNIVVSSSALPPGTPAFTGLDNNPTFTENSSSVFLDTDASVVDTDLTSESPIDGATLTLARVGGANGQDFISGNFDEGQVISQLSGLVVGAAVISDGTLTVTFNSDAVFADVNDVLQQLTYANASDAPPASVVIDYTFKNGPTVNDIATGSVTVTINAANDPPSIDAVNGSARFQPGSSGLVLSTTVLLSDPDNTMLSGATVSFADGAFGTDNLLANVGSTGILANFSAGVLTLSGAATLAQYRDVLESVTYTNSDSDPTGGGSSPTRVLRWQIKDAAGTLSGTADTIVDFAPGVDLDVSGVGFDFVTSFAQGGPPVAIADTDADIMSFNPISSVSVVLTNAKAGDVLSATGGPLSVSIDNSQPGRVTLVISGAGSEAQYEAALKSVTFSNPTASVDPTTRDLVVTVTDTNSPSQTAHATISITGTSNHPGSASDDTATVSENTVLSAPAPGVLANDNDPDGLVVVTGEAATSGGGLIQFNPDGSYSYAPAANFSGVDTVGYTAQDPFGSQVSATLRITVNSAGPTDPLPGTPGTPGDDSFTAAGQPAVRRRARHRYDQLQLPPGRRDGDLLGQPDHRRRSVDPHGADRLRDLQVHRRHGEQQRRRPAGRRPVLLCEVSRRVDRARRCGRAFSQRRLERGTRPGRVLLDQGLSLRQPGREGRGPRSAGSLRHQWMEGRPRSLDRVRSRALSRSQSGRADHRSAAPLSGERLPGGPPAVRAERADRRRTGSTMSIT